jgi:hypothetical protein
MYCSVITVRLGLARLMSHQHIRCLMRMMPPIWSLIRDTRLLRTEDCYDQTSASSASMTLICLPISVLSRKQSILKEDTSRKSTCRRLQRMPWQNVQHSRKCAHAILISQRRPCTSISMTLMVSPQLVELTGGSDLHNSTVLTAKDANAAVKPSKSTKTTE